MFRDPQVGGELGFTTLFSLPLSGFVKHELMFRHPKFGGLFSIEMDEKGGEGLRGKNSRKVGQKRTSIPTQTTERDMLVRLICFLLHCRRELSPICHLVSF